MRVKKTDKKTIKMGYFLGGALALLSIVFTILVKTVNVAPIGPNGSSVGFASINRAFSELVGVNMTWYEITEWLGLLPITFAAGYAVFGLVQLIRRRSLLKVDPGILALGGLFLVAFILYVVFDMVAINYRPVLIDGALDPSFPSSHTMLILCICFGIALLNLTAYRGTLPKVINIVAIILAIVILTGRILSGTHWLTDIIGGLLFANALLTFYCATLILLQKNLQKTS